MTARFGWRSASWQPMENHRVAAREQPAAKPRLQDWIAWLALALFSAGVAFYVWRVILEVPFEQPFGTLFGDQRQQVGWAPWWIAPLVAAVLSALIAKALVRRPGRVRPAGVFARAAMAAYVGVLCAGLVRNLGYVLLFVPGATWLDALMVLPQMTAMHWMLSAGVLAMPKGLPIVVAVPIVGLLLSLLRHPTWMQARSAGQPEGAGQVQPVAAADDVRVVTELTRTTSMVVYAVLVSMQAFFTIGLFVVVQIFINAVIWRHLALPDRRFAFARVLTVGTLSAGSINCVTMLPLLRMCTGLSTASCDWRPQAAAIILAQTLLFTAVVTWVVRARATNLKIAAAA
jgi:hypothetical protein